MLRVDLGPENPARGSVSNLLPIQPNPPQQIQEPGIVPQQERWRRRPDPGAPARLHAPLLAGTPDGILLFGGGDGTSSRADLWQWDGSRWHLLVPDSGD